MPAITLLNLLGDGGLVDPSRLGEAGLVLFVLSFVAVSIWAARQKRNDLDHWSGMPLEDGTAPQLKRQPAPNVNGKPKEMK